MKKILKRIIAGVLAGVMMLSSAVSSYAVNKEIDTVSSGNTIYVKTAEVPEDVTEYIRGVFADLYIDDLTFLGYTISEAINMRLCPGFRVSDYDGALSAENIYYFPVICENVVVGIFTVTCTNGGYNYSFGKSDVADSLNSLKTTAIVPAEIVVNDSATFYGIYVMDPNKADMNNYQLIGYSKSSVKYTINGKTYTWAKTLIK